MTLTESIMDISRGFDLSRVYVSSFSHHSPGSPFLPSDVLMFCGLTASIHQRESRSTIDPCLAPSHWFICRWHVQGLMDSVGCHSACNKDHLQQTKTFWLLTVKVIRHFLLWNECIYIRNDVWCSDVAVLKWKKSILLEHKAGTRKKYAELLDCPRYSILFS